MIHARHALWGMGLFAAVGCRDGRAAPPAPSSAGVAVAARRGGFIEANPLLSRARPVVGSSPARFADPKAVNDGDPKTIWAAGKPTPERPAWIAVDVGKGPLRVLLTWSAGGSFNYEETDYGSPGAYRIETSADSTDGVDGAFTIVVTAPLVTTHAAAHSFDFAGRRWVRFVVTGAPEKSPNGVQIDEIDIHDASLGASDAWFFMGDSITAFAFGRPKARDLGFAARVHARRPLHTPIVMGGGVGGDKSEDGVRHIDAWLAKNPDSRFWCLGYGTNDAAGNATDTSRFKGNMATIIGRIQRAGRVPIMARIPFASDGHHDGIPRFNDAIDDLRRTLSLPAGPDLHAWFSAHPEELRDGLHPNDRGIASINRLWADAVDTLYTR